MRVLIAGCGYVGTELGLRLAERGHRVFGLRRDPSDLPPPIEPVAADLLDHALVDRLPRVDRVVYAAAAGASTPEAYRRIYVEGVRNLLSALTDPDGASGSPDRGPDRFVFVSSTGVYGDCEGAPVDETTPTEPESFRGSQVLEGERVAKAGPLPATVLRLGGIYGPGRTRLLDRIRDGTAACPPGGPIWSNRIHRDDAAGALVHLLELPTPDAVYLGVDDRPTPICEVYRTLARMLDAPEPVVDESARRSRSNKRCINRRLRTSGFRFRYPSFEEGYRELIESAASGASPDSNPSV